MVLATWWYEDGQSGLKLPSDVIVESSADDETLTLLTGLSPDEICQRRADGNRSYIARVNGAPAAYGWVGTRACSIGELDLTFTLPAGNRYLWDFGTLPAFRGRGIYPHMLAEILRRECPPAVRLWVIHAPENLPSGIGIARAGFTPVAELSFTEDGRPALSNVGDDKRAGAAAELLGLPLVSTGLDSCWTCGGSCSGHGGDDAECDCAVLPRASAAADGIWLREAAERERNPRTDGDDPSSECADGEHETKPGQAGIERARSRTWRRVVSVLVPTRKSPPAVEQEPPPASAPSLLGSRPGMERAARAKHRIGPVVAASLFLGFLAAAVAVLGPFGGARENTITGAALVGFGLGWAALGTLSVRLTDQPQRWATVSAFLIASTGVLLMAGRGAVANDWIGWLWPSCVLALVVWMTFQARRHMRSRLGLGLLYVVFALFTVSAFGGAVQNVKETLDRHSLPMSGQLVSVGDHRLYISCIGAGSPTVVLEPGLGEPSSEMFGWIAPVVSVQTRVCVYDRAGRGWSESAPSSQDGREVARDLHTLLAQSGESGPYVLAGHSLGGIYVMNFASLYPGDVAGVVLLDSMHPQQYDRVATYPAFYQSFRRISALFPSLSRVGLARLVSSNGSGDLPMQAGTEERAAWSSTRQYRSLRDEFAGLPTTLKQAGELKSLGDKPLIVVTAGRGAQEGWPTLQDELAGLSSNILHRIVSDASHAALVEDKNHAAASSQAIVDVVSSVRTGQALSGEQH